MGDVVNCLCERLSKDVARAIYHGAMVGSRQTAEKPPEEPREGTGDLSVEDVKCLLPAWSVPIVEFRLK